MTENWLQSLLKSLKHAQVYQNATKSENLSVSITFHQVNRIEQWIAQMQGIEFLSGEKNDGKDTSRGIFWKSSIYYLHVTNSS